MSELRKHLQSAKGEYESLHYPGDLGSRILGHPRAASSGRWVVGAIFAAAAALFLTLWLNLPQPKVTPRNEVVQVEEEFDYTDSELGDTEEYVYTDLPVLSFPAIPDEVELTPPAPSFSVAVPSFSLLGEQTSEQESTSI